MRVRMEVAGNDEFIVKVRNRSGERALSEGQELNVGWDASDCKALDPPVRPEIRAAQRTMSSIVRISRRGLVQTLPGQC